MASLRKKGLFSLQSSIVNRLGGSTTIKLDASKSQNFPGGGVGARSSAVRRAISSKCQPTSSACSSSNSIPVIITDPIILASAAATAASNAESAASQALFDALAELESMTVSQVLGVLSPMASAELNEDSAASSAASAGAAGGTTASVYELYQVTSGYAALVSDSNAAIQQIAAYISAYSETITTNAQIAHENYVIAKALLDSQQV